MNVSALKAALLAYGGPPLSVDPMEAVYIHRYENGMQEYIAYAAAAKGALTRIEALERELMEIYADPWIKNYREHRKGTE